MTGTGTQADPYIVDNWEDFTNIISKSDIYVKWADSNNKVIDFNEVNPEGYTKSINFPANVDFNGWTLRNFHSIASTAIRYSGSSYAIKNLIFENFYIMSNTFIYGQYIIENCTFSGLIQGDTVRVFQGCGLVCSAVNIRINTTNSTYLTNSNDFVNSKSEIRNSDIVLDIHGGNTVEICDKTTTNSRISGKISATTPVKINGSNSSCNIINLESNQPLKYTGTGISVYNSDLAEKSSDSSSSFKACTSEQLKDSEYLYSIGFPIGIE